MSILLVFFFLQLFDEEIKTKEKESKNLLTTLTLLYPSGFFIFYSPLSKGFNQNHTKDAKKLK